MKFKFIKRTNVAGVWKNRWECPYCIRDSKMSEYRFDLKKEKETHKCRFCKRELEFGKKEINDYGIKMMEIEVNEIAQKKFEYWKEVFIKELLEISKENNWEVAINEGYEDGFRIISGEDWIKQKVGGEE